MNDEQLRKTVDDRLKASRDAALRALNQTETWWERHAGWLGWAICGAVVVAVLAVSVYLGQH